METNKLYLLDKICDYISMMDKNKKTLYLS